MSFYQRRNVDNRGGWLPSIFGMNPFNMMPSTMSNIFDPINHDIDRLLDRSLHWINVPEGRHQQQQTRQKPMSRQQSVPKQKQQMHQMHDTGIQQQHHTKQSMKQQCKMPQKFRILIDCSSCNPKTLKTHIKTVNDQKHLIVCVDEQKCKNIGDTSCIKFKRTYTLPKQVETNKMISFVTPNGQFVVEFPLQEVVCCNDIDMVPKIEKTPHEGRIVSLRVPIPESVDPAKVKLTVKGCECILRFEDRFGTEDCVSRVYFYNKCRLPDGCDVNKIKCCADKHRLIITAPLRSDEKTWQEREIKIERKIRHKTLLTKGSEQKMGQKQQSTQKNKNIYSTGRSKSPITTEQHKKSSISTQQKQKSPIKDIQKQKSPTKDTYMTSSNIDKDKNKKKKTSTTGDEKTGSDILKSVFGSGSGSGSSDKDKDNKDKKQSDKDKKNKSSVSGDLKSEFPLLPSDVKPLESHHQQQ